jgi:hypothetical protein
MSALRSLSSSQESSAAVCGLHAMEGWKVNDILASIEADERAMARIATALERWVALEEKRFAKEFPEPKVKRDAELIRADAGDKREQYNDKPTDEWLRETENAAGPSRFAKRLEETGTQAPSPKGRRSVEIPKRDGNKTNPN